MNLRSLTRYIAEDNKVSLTVYEELLKSYRASLVNFPKEVNLIGIFFFEILKLVTGTILRKRELEEYLVQDQDILEKEVRTWPYTGYRDLVSGLDPDKKIYGRPDRIAQTNFMRSAIALISTFRASLSTRKSFTVGIIGTGLDRQLAGVCLKYGWKVRLLDDRFIIKHIPKVEDQLFIVAQFIKELAVRISLPFKVASYENLIFRHIKSLVQEGMPAPLEIDALITGSGAEFYNRLISAHAQYYKIPVIRIHHGEGFGIADEPIFGVGDQSYADIFVGYGPFFNEHTPEYEYTSNMLWSPQYVSSSSPVCVAQRSSRNVQPLELGSATRRVFYFPTSLSGYMHRYGPYRDLPDELYLRWHNQIKQWLGPLTVKAHPKERYSALFCKYHQSFITTDLREMIDQVDVFVFDYISSAFFIAAATDKPIIFLDLGLRNIAKCAFQYIKERTHYVDIRKYNTLTKDEINSLLLIDVIKTNRLSEAFSFENTRRSRTAIVAEQLHKIAS
ncbi:MAG: hypothetical protein Q7S48_03035 [bacterium]|nr:hypothetical protein [bacterium]